MESIKNYISEHKERFLNELIELLKMPSVSADTAFTQDVLNTADAVKAALLKAGCDTVEICETDGYPIVYGEKIINSALPTILVYGPLLRLNLLSKKLKSILTEQFLREVLVMIKVKCTCM